MKKNILFTLAVAGLLLASCGGNNPTPTPSTSSNPPETSSTDSGSAASKDSGTGTSADASIGEVSVTLTLDGKADMVIGGQCMLTATVTGTDNQEVVWSSSDNEVATVDEGIVFGVGIGTATITATSVADPTKFATQVINVIDKTAGAKTVAELWEDEDIKALPNDGKTETTADYVLKATVAYVDTPYDATYKNISFYAYDAGKPETLVQVYRGKGDADIGLDISGLKTNDFVYVAGKVKNYKGTLEFAMPTIVALTPGEELPTAEKIEDAVLFSPGNFYGTVQAISERGYVLEDGTGAIYVFTGNGNVKYGDGTPIAIGDTVNASGVVLQALNDHGYYQLGGTIKTTRVEGLTPIERIATPLSADIADGLANAAKLIEYKAYTWETVVGKDGSYLVYPVEGSDTKIEFSYAPSALAGKEGGHYQVSAYFVGYDSKYDYACFVPYALEELLPATTSIAITNAPSSVKVGDIISLIADPEEGTRFVNPVVWSVDNEDVATIDAELGVLTAVAAGTVTVTATSGELSDSVSITVVTEEIPATSLTVTTDDFSIYLGSTATIEYEVLPADSTQRPTFSSSDETIATVDATTGVVTPVAAGKATITATIGILTDPVEVTVINPYGTLDNPRSITEVLQYMNGFKDGEFSAEKLYIFGTVTKVDYAYSGTDMSLHIGEPNGPEFYLYKVHVDSETDIPSVNDQVIAYGYVQKYVASGGSVTPEMTSKDKDYGVILQTVRLESEITLGAHDHATVEGLPASAVNGATVTFTAEADEGYVIDSVMANNKKLEPKEAGSSIYSFTLDGPTTITVTTVDASIQSKSIDMNDANITWPTDYATAPAANDFVTTDGLKFNAVGIKQDSTEGILLGKGKAVMYNTEALPGTIAAVKITFSSKSAKNFTKIYVTTGETAFTHKVADGATANITGCAANVTVTFTPEAGSNHTFFQIANLDASNNGRFATITILYK